MATFDFTSPEGKSYTIEGPAGATKEQAFEMLQTHLGAAKPSSASDTVSRGIRAVTGPVNDTLMGLTRGAARIGETLLSPTDALSGYKNRKADIEGAMTSMGADKGSMMYGAGDLGAQIAGTAGVGGALAKFLPAGSTIANALRTTGMTTGAAPAKFLSKAGLTDFGIRSLAGGTVGAASAGLTGDSVGTGAVIGGAAPGAMKLAGAAGSKIGNMLKPDVAPDVLAAVSKARDLGYVIPPTQANPTLGNRLVEGYAGKLTTAQNASAKNAGVTNELANKALGLPAGTSLTPEILGDVRRSAGQAYEAVKGAGVIRPDQSYNAALDSIAAPYVTAAKGFPSAKPSPILDMVESLRSPEFDSSSAIAMIGNLRDDASKAYASGDKATGKAIKSAAGALEDAVENHLKGIAQPSLLKDFRDARTLIAKTYSVEGALNKTTGTVDARKLASQIQRGKPLTGELREAGEFAGRFPTAAKTVESMGSLPQNSPLDFAAGGIASAAHGNVMPLIAALAGRPLARKLALSDLVQGGLSKPQSTSKLRELLTDREVQQLMYRMAPISAQ